MREEPVRVATAEEEAASFQKAWADSLSENARLRAELARVEKERDDALRINSKYATRLCAVNKTIASVNQLAENLAEAEARAQSAEASLEEMREALENIKGLVCGDRVPFWNTTDNVTAARGVIADQCDAALRSLIETKGGEDGE